MCRVERLPTVTRSQATVWIASCRNRSGSQEQAREQAQVDVVSSGSRGPSGQSSVLPLAQDNVSETGCGGTSRAGRPSSGILTGTGESGSQRTSHCRACVRVGQVVWAVRAGIER